MSRIPLLLAFLPLYAAAQSSMDHAPAPMFNEPSDRATSATATNADSGPNGSVDELPSFRALYESAGRPRVALLWNHVFDVDGGPRLIARLAEDYIDHDLALSSETAVYAQSASPSRLDPVVDRIIETGFVGTLLSNGVRIVDRQAIQRLLAHTQSSSVAEQGVEGRERLETGSLLGYADLILEVVIVDSGVDPLDASFSLSVLDLGTGQIRAQLTSAGLDTALRNETRWVSTDDGYEKQQISIATTEADTPITRETRLDKKGRKMAFDLAAQLAQSWSKDRP